MLASAVVDVHELRRRVEELAARDASYRVFGASSHKYRFHAPVEEAVIAALEGAHGFRLPEDFRAFVLTVGNGGAGPSYGVIPFHGKDSEDYTDYKRLGTAWKYADAHNPEHLLWGDEDDQGDDDQEARQRAYWAACESTGAFYLCHHGCASRSLLVVSGPQRGEVWHDETANDAGLYPAVSAAGARLTFTTWYLDWIDTELAKLA